MACLSRFPTLFPFNGITLANRTVDSGSSQEKGIVAKGAFGHVRFDSAHRPGYFQWDYTMGIPAFGKCFRLRSITNILTLSISHCLTVSLSHCLTVLLSYCLTNFRIPMTAPSSLRTSVYNPGTKPTTLMVFRSISFEAYKRCPS